MLKSTGIAVLFGTSLSLACSGTTIRLKGEEMEPGVFRVLRTTGYIQAPGFPDKWDSIGISRMADFKAYYQNVLADNDLVFIGRLDSVIEKTNYSDTTSPPDIVPQIVLAPQHGPQTFGPFWARMNIDTIIKGTLPSKRFWFKGYRNGSSCDVGFRHNTRVRFLNFSDKFDSMPDLKLSDWENFCANCPRAHTFDGRYLRSPQFPVLALDITELYPDYPATGIMGRRNMSIVPWKPGARAYLPDGRVAPDGGQGRKTALPILKRDQ